MTCWSPWDLKEDTRESGRQPQTLGSRLQSWGTQAIDQHRRSRTSRYRTFGICIWPWVWLWRLIGQGSCRMRISRMGLVILGGRLLGMRMGGWGMGTFALDIVIVNLTTEGLCDNLHLIAVFLTVVLVKVESFAVFFFHCCLKK